MYHQFHGLANDLLEEVEASRCHDRFNKLRRQRRMSVEILEEGQPRLMVR